MARKMLVDVLGMIVTERCNLECEHCLRGCRSNKIMSDDVIEATLSNFDYIETLAICGGEVTLSLDVVEKIINYIIKHEILVGEIIIFEILAKQLVCTTHIYFSFIGLVCNDWFGASNH